MTKRLRVFAGPNGSGKSTIIDIVRSREINLGVYVNADEIKVCLDTLGYVNLADYNLKIDSSDFFQALHETTIISKAFVAEIQNFISVKDTRLILSNHDYNDAFSTFVADFIRSRLILSCDKFSFETVMSHHSKLEFRSTCFICYL